MKKALLLTLLMVIALACPALGQEGNVNVVPPRFDPKQPIHITADRLEVQHNSRIIRFIGNVVAVQNDAVINCDLLLIHYRSEQAETPAQPENPLTGIPETGGEIERLLAIGRVQMVQGNRRATCQQAEYNQQQETILLTGNPEIAQGQDVLRGAKIVIYVRTQRVHVLGQGSNRVRVTINPGANTREQQ